MKRGSWGGVDYHVYIFITCLIAIDYITGIIYAVESKTFTSSRMREGLIHKVSYLIAIILGEIIVYTSHYINLGYSYSSGILALICVWISITEVSSIIENLAKLNPEMRDARFLRLFKNSNDNEDEDEGEENRGQHGRV